MLSIQRRVFKNYFLMDRDNRNQPEKFIGNRVTGIVRPQAARAHIH
jgi:endo-1,3(4)-beta-glucanase